MNRGRAGRLIAGIAAAGLGLTVATGISFAVVHGGLFKAQNANQVGLQSGGDQTSETASVPGTSDSNALSGKPSRAGKAVVNNASSENNSSSQVSLNANAPNTSATPLNTNTLNTNTAASSSSKLGHASTGNTDFSGPAGPPPASPTDPVTAAAANAPSPVRLDETDQIQVTAYNRLGATLDLSHHKVTYTLVSGPAGAKVSSGGQFTATAVGMYTVNVKVDGLEANQVTIVELSSLKLTVSASNAKIAGAGQSTLVTAHVADGQRQDQAGVTVHFAVPSGSPVKLNHTSAVTDVNGLAQVRVSAVNTTNGGTAEESTNQPVTVTASMAGGKSGSDKVSTITIEVNTTPPVPASLAHDTLPNYLTTSGAILDFYVRDKNGANLEGVPVQATVNGTATKVEDNGYGTYYVFVIPKANETNEHVEVTVPGTNLKWTGDFTVRPSS